MDLGALGGALLGGLGGSVGDLLGIGLQGYYNGKSADKQMLFQEKMAGSQYQRAAADLEAAGLNRVIALGSPAASPGGAAASIQAPALGDSFRKGMDSYSARQVQREQVNLMKSQSQKELAQADLASAQALQIREMAPVQMEGILSQNALNRSHMGRNDAEVARLRAVLPQIAQEIATSKALEQLHRENASTQEIKNYWLKQLKDRLGPRFDEFLDNLLSKDGPTARYIERLGDAPQNLRTTILDAFMGDFDDWTPRRGSSATGKW